MGQGTDSCGGYEVDYDEYEEGLELGVWTQRGGAHIHVSMMTVHHLESAKRLVLNLAKAATFSCERDKWKQWAEVFDDELSTRAPAPTPSQTAAKPIAKRGATVKMVCHCSSEYDARSADLKRGWALSCSKRCAAIRREFNRPAAKPKRN